HLCRLSPNFRPYCCPQQRSLYPMLRSNLTFLQTGWDWSYVNIRQTFYNASAFDPNVSSDEEDDDVVEELVIKPDFSQIKYWNDTFLEDFTASFRQITLVPGAELLSLPISLASTPFSWIPAPLVLATPAYHYATLVS